MSRRVLPLIAVGGALGALARFGLGAAWPTTPGQFPWATFAINVSGCLLIGALMVLVVDLWPARQLLRPFLGTGVLGGYTTFSAYAVDGVVLGRGSLPVAGLYLAGTLVTALAAVAIGGAAVRRWARAA